MQSANSMQNQNVGKLPTKAAPNATACKETQAHDGQGDHERNQKAQDLRLIRHDIVRRFSGSDCVFSHRCGMLLGFSMLGSQHPQSAHLQQHFRRVESSRTALECMALCKSGNSQKLQKSTPSTCLHVQFPFLI